VREMSIGRENYERSIIPLPSDISRFSRGTGEVMSNYWEGETPAEKESRLALAACLNADVIFRGVRDGLCYLEMYFTDDQDGPKAILSLPTDGLTAGEISNHAAEAAVTADPELGERRCPNGHDSSLPPPLPELIFKACGRLNRLIEYPTTRRKRPLGSLVSDIKPLSQAGPSPSSVSATLPSVLSEQRECGRGRLPTACAFCGQ
jgi:hypothetical protein